MCFQKATDHHSHHTYTTRNTYPSLSLSLALSLYLSLSEISQSKQCLFSETATTSTATTTETEHNTTHRKLSSDPHYFSFFLLLTLYVLHLFEKRFLGFREKKKKKCIPKWIQPNPITYRVFFFASTSTSNK